MESFPTAPVLLGLLLVATGFAVARDKRHYIRFKAMTSTEDRQRFFRRWIVEPFFLYGVTAVVGLVLIGEASALARLPEAFAGLAADLRSSLEDSDGGFWAAFGRTVALIMLPVLVLGTTAGSFLRTYTLHKQGRSDPASDARDLDALMPRNAQERKLAALLSLNAGLSEELFFRLLAPLLVWQVTGNAVVSIVVASLWFGVGHFYQGALGIVVTTLLGVMFALIYLFTGSIWLVVGVHALLDLNGLFFSPWFADWLERRDA